jgi:effector-binding domain-containing protein
MDYNITIQHEPGRHLAVSRFDGGPSEIPEKIGAAFGLVAAYLERHGLRPVGPAVAFYEVRGPSSFTVSAGFVVHEPVEGDEQVRPLRLPPVKVVTTTHTGPYTDLPKAYDALTAKATELGLSLDQKVMWEEYLTGPDTPSEQHVTVVRWPVDEA